MFRIHLISFVLNLILFQLLLFDCIESSPVGSFCNFENDFCNWIDPDNNAWFLANDSSKVDPGYDHTCTKGPFLKCGHWLSTIPPVKFQGTQTFKLINNDRLTFNSNQAYCLSFWYHFMGMEDASFEVAINNKKSDFNANTLWKKITPQGNTWMPGYVNIPPQETAVYLMFKATLNSKFHDTVGIDDLNIQKGECLRTSDCDFESDMCGWTNQGFDYMNGTYPTYDHTTNTGHGHYLLLSGPNKKASLAAMVKQIIPDISQHASFRCLKVWVKFIMNLSNSVKDTQSYIEFNNTIENHYNTRVSIQDIFKDGRINQWTVVPFTIYSYGNISKVTGTAFTHGNTKIALDDFLITPNVCYNSGECNFESDFCGWTNDGQQLWIRNSGQSSNVFKGTPPYDATTKTKNGWYAMVPTEFSNFFVSRLTSPPLKQRLRCFAFSYYAVSTSKLYPIILVTINDLTKSTIFFQTWVNSSYAPNWNVYSMTFTNLPKIYSIELSTNSVGYKLTSDIAIDDISFNTYKCKNGPFIPITTTPVPPSELKWDCDFDRCNSWEFDENWTVTSYYNAVDKSLAPRIDHTQKSPRKNYLLWTPKVHQNDTLNNSTSISILSTIFNVNDWKPHCLTFWYYDSTELPFILSVYRMGSSRSDIQLINEVVRSGVGENWRKLKVTFYPTSKQGTLQIQLRTLYGVAGSFAIDDITIRHSTCDHSDGFSYSFDQIDDLEIAHLQPIGSKVGSVIRAGDFRYPAAPNTDFTTGKGNYFLFMNNKGDYNTTYQTDLIIPNLPSTKNNYHCVRFAYQLYGVNTTLSISYDFSNANYETHSFVTSTPHANWVMGQFSYQTYYIHQIVFDMSKTFDTGSYIALDEISIIDRPCFNSLDCDFDENMCSFYFTHRMKENYDLSQMIAPPRSISFPGPTFDHTKRSYGGGYLYMTGFPSTKDIYRVSTLGTPIQKILANVNFCLSFWSQITSTDGVLSINIRLYSQTIGSKNEKLFYLTNVTENTWTFHSVSIPLKLLTHYNEFEFSIITSTNKAKTVVAIDDIKLDSDLCEFKNKFVCANGQKINVQNVCDFVNDCKDGSDEARYNCNFDPDEVCDWTNNNLKDESDFWKSNYGIWRSIKASRADQNYPKVDGDGQKNGYYLALMPVKINQTNAKRTLGRWSENYVTTFKEAYHTCKLTFDYFMNEPQQETRLYITVLVGNELGKELARRNFYNSSSQWQKASVHIGAYAGPFSVALEGMTIESHGVIAIDNIKFVDCGRPAPSTTCPDGQILCDTTKICIDKEDLCDFQNDCGDNWDEGYSTCSKEIFDTTQVVPNCDFELSQDFCGFTNDTPASYFYFTDRHGSGSLLIMPSSDHTTRGEEGQYVSLYITSTIDPEHKSRLYTPMMTSKGGACVMHFFYNNILFQAKSSPSLLVSARYADGSKSSSGTLFFNDQPTYDWVKGRVSLDSSEPFQFVFEGMVLHTSSSISLDDVSFSSNCILSDAKYRPGKKSVTVIVILVLLAVFIVSGLGFFLYRRHKENRLSMPNFLSKGTTTKAAFVNDSYRGT